MYIFRNTLKSTNQTIYIYIKEEYIILIYKVNKPNHTTLTHNPFPPLILVIIDTIIQ